MGYTISEIQQLLKYRAEKDQELRSIEPLNWDIINTFDEGSYQLVSQIVQQYGAVSISKFGEEASSDAWLLVQHSTNHVDFMRHYLDLMMQNPDDFIPRNIAYLTDRVFMYEEKPQVYGTQLRGYPDSDEWYVYETIDPKHVNQRRAEVGIGPIEEYCEGMNIDLTEFKG